MCRCIEIIIQLLQLLQKNKKRFISIYSDCLNRREVSRSPTKFSYLNPTDFCFWSYMKKIVNCVEIFLRFHYSRRLRNVSFPFTLIVWIEEFSRSPISDFPGFHIWTTQIFVFEVTWRKLFIVWKYFHKSTYRDGTLLLVGDI